MMMILFEFYVNPIPYLQQNLKEMGSYRKNEKSIGIRIIVTDENFFSKSEEERYIFLKQSILQKLDLLAEVVKKKKLDTKASFGVKLDKTVVTNQFNQDLDMFEFLPFDRFTYISERLKSAFVTAKITGIDFEGASNFHTI